MLTDDSQNLRQIPTRDNIVSSVGILHDRYKTHGVGEVASDAMAGP